MIKQEGNTPKCLGNSDENTCTDGILVKSQVYNGYFNSKIWRALKEIPYSYLKVYIFVGIKNLQYP